MVVRVPNVVGQVRREAQLGVVDVREPAEQPHAVAGKLLQGHGVTAARA
jgi:hypothetical protein